MKTFVNEMLQSEAWNITRFHLNFTTDTLFCFSAGCDWLACCNTRQTQKQMPPAATLKRQRMYFCFQMGVKLNHFLTYQRAANKLIIESFLKAQIPNVCCFSQFYIIVDLVSSGWWILGDGSGLWELVKQMSCTHTGYKLRDRVVCSSG